MKDVLNVPFFLVRFEDGEYQPGYGKTRNSPPKLYKTQKAAYFANKRLIDSGRAEIIVATLGLLHG